MATSLDDLVEAIQSAVIKAQQLSEDHHVNIVGRFFEQDAATGQMRAKMQEIWIPSMNPEHAENTHVRINVPLMSLANLGAIRIKELTVEFDTKLGSLEAKDANKDGIPDVLQQPTSSGPAGDEPTDGGPAPRGRRSMFGKLGMGKRLAFDMKQGGSADDATTAHVSITFTGEDPPEGVIRLNGLVIRTLP
jgi:hypothetical protein